MRPRILALALSSAFSLACANVGAAVLDQDNSSNSDSGFNVNGSFISWQQEIQAGIAGQLAQIDLFYQIRGAAVQDFQFSLFSGGGWHDGTPLYSTQIAPAVGTISIDVSSANLMLSPGTTFTIAIRGLGPDSGCCNLRGSGYGFYPAGQLFLNGSLYSAGDIDLGFRSYVNAVPEPSSYALMAVGLVGIAALRRRSRKGDPA